MANEELPEDLRRIVTRGEGILNIIRDIFEANHIELPGRQYVTIGGEEESAHDEEQLTVSFSGLKYGITPTSQGMINTCFANYIATYVVELVRCTPQANNKTRYKEMAPGADKIHEVGVERAIDSWLLLRVGQQIKQEETSLGDIDFSIEAGKESGGVQAIKLTIDCTV